jgi:hypothetical protein
MKTQPDSIEACERNLAELELRIGQLQRRVGELSLCEMHEHSAHKAMKTLEESLTVMVGLRAQLSALRDEGTGSLQNR